MKQMRTQVTEDASEERHRFLDDDRRHVAGGASMCKFFINGLCNRGSQCLFSHSLQAKRPVCKFFFSLQVSIFAHFSPYSLNFSLGHL